MKISQATFAGSSTRTHEKPKVRLPEFAFIGRSNVGKSSLINMLCGQRRLALTSSTPGKTKLVNHFLINGEWYLVDLPGYGYAKMPLKEKEKLQAVIRDYLNHSDELVKLFVLVDCRHSLQKADIEFITELGGSDIPFAIIFTKGDKMGPVARRKQINDNIMALAGILGGAPEYFESSSQTGLGKEEILGNIGECLQKMKQADAEDNEDEA
ncbi:MAG: YihA family ribosome biogenesis GTP-binding protein [Bacteroidales bacterium]|nr:YihA family ribosome biogenesis GTP-binding protein [Bacteroidales bacterium]MBQ6576320.1 YihA family ribosome biogenesis GTP-binding protein [Bacteroidales bacterium]